MVPGATVEAAIRRSHERWGPGAPRSGSRRWRFLPSPWMKSRFGSCLLHPAKRVAPNPTPPTQGKIRYDSCRGWMVRCPA
jgi:hypothetical protein